MPIQVKPLVGTCGVLIAGAAAELNDQVTAVAIRDIAGGLAISHDPSTWLDSLYVSAEAVGMSVAPWMLVTFTVRQFTLFVILLNALSTLLIPFSHSIFALYLLRALRGMSGGLTIPLLLTSAATATSPPPAPAPSSSTRTPTPSSRPPSPPSSRPRPSSPPPSASSTSSAPSNPPPPSPSAPTRPASPRPSSTSPTPRSAPPCAP